MLQDSDKAQLQSTVERATYRNPFLQDFEFSQSNQGEYTAQFQLAAPIEIDQIRIFGNRLYKSFRDSGLLVNVIFENQDKDTLLFTIKYNGMKVQ